MFLRLYGSKNLAKINSESNARSSVDVEATATSVNKQS